MNEPLALSIIVPAYNESRRLPASIARIGAWIAERNQPAEILVVDDGSTDGTAEAARRAAARLGVPVRVARYARNSGKGFAVKVGVSLARGEVLLVTDADLSVSIDQADRLCGELDESCDIVIGSRKLPGARIAVAQPWYRTSMGKVFTWLVRSLIAPVSDATCGFKVFRRTAGQDLFSRVRIYDWSFDAEVLWLAARSGTRIREVPVRWEDRDGSKVRLSRDVIQSFIGLLRVRWNGLRGVYERENDVQADVELWSSTAPVVTGEP